MINRIFLYLFGPTKTERQLDLILENQHVLSANQASLGNAILKLSSKVDRLLPLEKAVTLNIIPGTPVDQ